VVASEIEPKTQAEMSGFEEPKPITYIGGPLTGQKRADDGQARKVVKIGPDEEVYYRTELTVCKGGVRADLCVMAYHGKAWAEVIPRSWTKKAQDDKDKEGPAEAVGG
jgi:hypothetical protein